ncbi:MAG: glycosyl hydrolase [Candidatus Hydrogenedentes bacterium]|nr:glycosyl hydrolase [Candidatus Hydrogenedentota bacterium]
MRIFTFTIIYFCFWAYSVKTEAEQSIVYEIPIFTEENHSLQLSGITFIDANWEIDFSKHIQAEVSHPSYSLFGTPQKFIIQLWTSSMGWELEILLGSHFQFFKKTIRVTGYGLQTIEINAPPEGWEYFSGENDGKVRTPLRFLRFYIKKGSCPSEILRLRFLKFICETILPPPQECIIISNISKSEGEKILCSCEIRNLLPREVSGNLRVKIKDWDENILHESVFSNILLCPGGEKMQFQLTHRFPEEKKFLEAEWIFERSDGNIFKNYSTICKEPSLEVDKLVNEASPWGMGMYFYRYGNNQIAREKSAEMGSKAGIKWTREDFSWSIIEPSPGKFTFDYYDNIVNTGLKYGISTYALLCYWAPWTEPYTMKGIEDFVNYTRRTVQHFKDRIKYWEVYNEPNIFFWQGPKELYPELVKKCYQVIKEIDPKAKVLAISTSGIDFQFIKKCLEANTPFDILTVHPYRKELNEEKFINELKRTHDLIGGRPIWITEMGWSTHLWTGGVTEREQALLIARCYLSALASGVVENISWYDFRNDGNDPFYFEENFGIVRSDFSLKPAYLACANICTQIRDKNVVTLEFSSDNLIGIKHQHTTVIWAFKKDSAITIKAIDDVTITNLVGEEVGHIKSGKKRLVTLKKPYPIFIRGNCKVVEQTTN